MAFNQQHASGVDLDGEQGGAFFEIGQPRAYAQEGNVGSTKVAETAFDAANIDRLRATDYTVRVTNTPVTGAADFEVIRKDSGEALGSADIGFDATSGELSFGGVTLTFDDTAVMAQNDRFEVQPVRRAAGNLESAIADLDKIAAGGPDGGSGNNENALALQDLQDDSIVSGSASLSGAYGAMVSDVGNRTNIVQVNLDAQQGLTDQLKAVQQSESGVNLDEEAANLIRYQQFYQANAKVIETGTTVIDTILGLRN